MRVKWETARDESDWAVYQGNVFLGKLCELVIKKLISSVIADKQKHYIKFRCIFQIFSELCLKLFIKSRCLTNGEIRLVGKLCRDFGKDFPLIFPDKDSKGNS